MSSYFLQISILFSAGVDQLLLELHRMLQVVVLVLLLGAVEILEGFHTDVDGASGSGFQIRDAAGGNLPFRLGQVVDSQGIGMTPVNELTAAVEGIHAGQEMSKRLS